jgi:hypothetical protein
MHINLALIKIVVLFKIQDFLPQITLTELQVYAIFNHVIFKIIHQVHQSEFQYKLQEQDLHKCLLLQQLHHQLCQLHNYILIV